jgi:hypothetical protein
MNNDAIAVHLYAVDQYSSPTGAANIGRCPAFKPYICSC